MELRKFVAGEVELWCMLDHQNVATLYGILHTDGYVYILQEWGEGNITVTKYENFEDIFLHP